MKVYCTVAYFAGRYDQANELYEQHMSTMAFVKTLKGMPFKVPRRLGGVMMAPGQQVNAMAVYASWALETLRNQHDLQAPFHIVPVPGSKVDLGVPSGAANATAHLMAIEVAKLIPERARVVDALRFVKRHASAHEGNKEARNVDWLTENMTVTAPRPTGGSVILVDDVFTSGAHLAASRNVLRAKWSVTDPRALCAARTVKEFVPKPYPYPHVVSV